MKYRTKLYLAFVGIGVISVILALGIVYSITKEKLFQQMRTKVASIAAAAAGVVDAELLKTIHPPQNSTSSNYDTLQKQLRRVADVNHREDINIRYVYTIIPSPSDPNQLVFLVDSAENPEGPGTVYSYSDAQEILAHLDFPYGDMEFTSDPLGMWLSGFAPIYDNRGNYIGTVGLDADLHSILNDFHRLLLYGFISLCSALLLAIILAYLLSQRATSSLISLNRTVKEIGQGNLQAESHLRTMDEFESLGDAINDMAQGLQERERLKMNFARYVSQYVMEKILQSDTHAKLEGEKKKITILICDIRQFTMLAENMHPEHVVSLLNQYFEKMLDVIFRNYGTLDKFLGDGIMVEFGAPLEDPNQENNAVVCALQMQEELNKLCDVWEKEGKPRIKIGIGIHTGLAIVGNIGAEKRMAYTAIGNAVTIAQALERATKTTKRPILISEQTASVVQDRFKLENLGEITLPEIAERTTAYAVLLPPSKMEEKA
ncbi:MAG TPA: adenylate/guanylate cyclase domain-containing protein [Rhabdochlamydiaceae bacterium]|nr:adenylate/guanylate cyclase domain-containing protein [Rhabdochlamydiaceae bacterium]